MIIELVGDTDAAGLLVEESEVLREEWQPRALIQMPDAEFIDRVQYLLAAWPILWVSAGAQNFINQQIQLRMLRQMTGAAKEKVGADEPMWKPRYPERSKKEQF